MPTITSCEWIIEFEPVEPLILNPTFLKALLIQEPRFSEGSDAAGFHEAMSVAEPFAVGEIVSEHGRRGLRLFHDAERHIGFGQPHQRLFDVTRGLVPGDDDFEAVDGAGVILLLEIITPDRHFLAGELIARDLHFLLGAGGVFAGRIFPHHLVERGKRLVNVRAWSQVMSGISS